MSFLYCVLAIVSASAAQLLAETPPVVRLVKEIHPGQEGSDPAIFVTLHGIACFRANDGVHGFELWRTDGTSEGTKMVVDLNPGEPNGFPDSITALNGSLYFNGFDTPNFTGSKVWRSDGTAAGTTLLADTFPALQDGGTFGPPLPSNFAPLDSNTVLFSALDRNGGLEPWKTDGTPAGTRRIVDLHPGEQWSVPIDFTAVHGISYFAADNSVVVHPDGTATFNREIFRTDGNAAGTYRIKDINPGPQPSTPTDFARYNRLAFFRADDGIHGPELWRTNGTAEKTVMVTDLNPGKPGSLPQDLLVARFRSGNNPGDLLVFLADDGRHGAELFRSDGTAAGTGMIKDINRHGDSVPLGMTEFKGRVYFSADDGVHGNEVWVTDGTAAGTKLFADLNPGPGRSGPQSFTVLGDHLFFVSIVPNDVQFTVRTRLWMTDGTSAGTRLVYEEPGNSFGYAIDNLTPLRQRLLFTAPNDVDKDGFSSNTELFSLSAK